MRGETLLSESAAPVQAPPVVGRRWFFSASLLGAIGSVGFLWLAPLHREDSLFGTLAILPFVFGAFLDLEGWLDLERSLLFKGAALVSRRARLWECAALALLVLLAFRRDALGLAVADRVLMAGFVLVLGRRVLTTLAGLVSVLGPRLSSRPGVAYFVLPLLVYLALLPWSTGQRPPDGDEPYFLLLSHSLMHDLDVDLANNYAQRDSLRFMPRAIEPQHGDPVGDEGQQYSRHDALLPLVLGPAYLVGGRFGALLMMALMTAAVAWLTLRVAGRYFPDSPTEAVWVYGLVAFAPPLLSYSYQIWTEVPAALLLLFGVDRVLAGGQGSSTPRRRLQILLALGLLPLVKLRFATLSLSLLVLAWLRGVYRWRALVFATVAVGTLGAALASYNFLTFGNPMKYRSLQALLWPTLSLESHGRGLLGLTMDCAFGLFAVAPIWLLLLPAAVTLGRRRHPLSGHLLILSIPYLAFLLPRSNWYGSWSPPFRYGLILLPLAALTLIPLLHAWRRRGFLFPVQALGGLTLPLAVLWVLVPGWTFNHADGGNHVLDLLDSRLGLDLTRLFPSVVRVRDATWWWLAGVVVVVTAILWLSRRRERVSPSLVAPGWAAVVLLLLSGVGPLAARLLPTRIIEIEDEFASKTGGKLYPERWLATRAREQGGWLLRPGDRVEVPVVAGGNGVDLEVAVRARSASGRPIDIGIEAGGRRVATIEAESTDEWTTYRVTVDEWPVGAPLVIRRDGTRSGRLLIDKVRLTWFGRE